MEKPKFNETFLPILDILGDGKVLSGRGLIKLVEEKYYSEFPEELLSQKIKSGDRLIENRIALGKSYLKMGGLVHYPQRGYVQITEDGKNINIKDLNREQMDKNVVDFYKPGKEKLDVSLSTASPQDLIDSGIEQIQLHVKNELLEKLKTYDPYAFEKVVLILLKKMGYGEFTETSKSRDGGIDGVINQDQLGLEKNIYTSKKIY